MASPSRTLLGAETEVIPYLGSLYALDYPQIAEFSPEYRKQRIHEALVAVFDALGQRGPTVYFIEDLHWADPSTLELVRHVLKVVEQPAVFLSTYRPPFQLYTGAEAEAFERHYREISLEAFSPDQVEEMTAALLCLGQLHAAKKRPQQAQEYLAEAIEIFAEIGADGFLAQARDAMAALTAKQ